MKDGSGNGKCRLESFKFLNEYLELHKCGICLSDFAQARPHPGLPRLQLQRDSNRLVGEGVAINVFV